MRLAFVTDELPRPGMAGHLALNHAIITWAQAQGHDVKILLTGTRLASPVTWYPLAPVAGPHFFSLGHFIFPKTPCALITATARLILKKLPQTIVNKINPNKNTTATLGNFTSPTDAAWCAAHIKRWQPDAIFIDTIFRTPVIDALQNPDLNTILVTHDVFHRRHAALAAAGYRVIPETLSYQDEASYLQRASFAAAVQPEEAALITAMRHGKHTFVLPMPATPCPRPPGLQREQNRLVFLGSDSLPNLDGLRWFLAEIWPHLAGHNIILDIIGDAGPALGRVPEDVKIHGRVKNPEQTLHRASLAIAPLRVGSGLKIKLLDYARHGLTTITTSNGLAGFAPDGAPFIQADTNQAFAQAIITALPNPPADQAAFAYIAKYYGNDSVFDGLAAALACNETITKR
jgi:hypothetical protein